MRKTEITDIIMPSNSATTFANALEVTLKHSLAKKVASDILECPVCWEDINGDLIYQCGNGHLLCYNCQAKLHSCPVCRIKLEGTPIRNLALEKLLERLITKNRSVAANMGQQSSNRKHSQASDTINLGKYVRNKYIRISCSNCNSRFLCEDGLKYVYCPRPYCKSKINLDPSPLTLRKKNPVNGSNGSNISSRHYLEALHSTHERARVINEPQTQFPKEGVVKPNRLAIGLLSFITIFTIGAVGVTSDTIILAILVASLSYRKISVSSPFSQQTGSIVNLNDRMIKIYFLNEALATNICNVLCQKILMAKSQKLVITDFEISDY